MDDLSDTQIRASLRTLLVESGIDPNRTSFVCASGVVRMLGELLGMHDAPVQPAQLDTLEQNIRRTRGVSRVYFHPSNWQRQASGQWKPVEKRRRKEQLSDTAVDDDGS